MRVGAAHLDRLFKAKVFTIYVAIFWGRNESDVRGSSC